MLIATGLDPDRSTVFAQSHVTAHAEASWLLSAVASYGQLGRMTQFKDKAEQPGLRLGRAVHLSRADGRRHPALPDRHRPDRRRPAPASRARARCRRALQRRFGETFVVPDGVYPEVGARIMDLQEPTKKMSTTGDTPQGTVRLLDEPDVIRKKFRSAVTDSGSEVSARRGQAGGVEPDRHPLRRDRPSARGDRGGVRRRRLRSVQAGRRRSSGVGARRRSRSATGSSGATRASYCGYCGSAPTRRERRRRRRSRRCTAAWGLSASRDEDDRDHGGDRSPSASSAACSTTQTPRRSSPSSSRAQRSAGLAWIIGVGTESVGARFGPAVTGVLQSTLGNLPELFIVVFALRAGETVVAQTSILGSLFANALLVLGLAIVAGSFRAAGRRRCGSRSACRTTRRRSSCSPSSSSSCSGSRTASATGRAGIRSRSRQSEPWRCSASTPCGLIGYLRADVQVGDVTRGVDACDAPIPAGARAARRRRRPGRARLGLVRRTRSTRL